MAPESRDEVRQRIASLYDQAENATGNFNATRAMAGRSRSRSRGVPLAKRAGRRPDPELDEVARQWFDAARAKLGPTVPAVLPADRLTDGPAAPARSGRERTAGFSGGEREPRALPGGGDALALPGGGDALALPGGDREVRALPGGERQALELEAGAARPVAELTAGPPAAPTNRPPQSPETGLTGIQGLELPREALALTGGAMAEPGGGRAAPTPVNPAAAQGLAVQAPRTLPGAAVPGRPSPAVSKAGNRRKLDTARDLLSRHTNRLALPGTAAQPAWAAGTEQLPPPAAPAEPAEQWQQPQWTTPGRPATGTPAVDTGSLTPLQDTGSLTTLTDTGTFTPLTDTGSVAPLTGTGSFTSLTGTGTFTAPTDIGSLTALTDTGSLTALADTGTFTAPAGTGPFTTLTGTGTFTPPTDTGAYAPPTDTGSLTALTGTGSIAAVTGTGTLPPLTGTTASSAPLATSAASSALPLPLSLPLPAATPASPGALRAAKAIAFARAQIGKPCVWGATGPDSYDCSSLTQAAWRAAGVTLPRAAYEQALAGTPVTLADLEPGDLVLFFDDDRHVGLHVGDGMMVHAPGPGSTIREESVFGAGEAAIHRIVRPA
ncbi:NlpC/P60 family protein [Streptomyces cinerochromogenes]|uniref:NlpC/P60 family protein n=1 Tax=Streptomyces cinerochromogenes TaxID=66422 RepID=UPI003676BDF5